MPRLWMSVAAATIALNAANAKIDTDKLLAYIKTNVVKNPQVKVKGVSISDTATHKELPGWDVVFVSMKLEFKKQELSIPEMFFINKDGLITTQLGNLHTGKTYRELIRPKVPETVYDDAHLLYGNKNAKHKVIVFSDPMCPFCRQEVPGLLKAAKEHPDKIALYYYHLPLRNIHPVSDVLTRIMHEAQKEGKKEVIDKMYTINLPFKETNVKKIIAKVKEHTGYEITEAKANAKEAKEAIKHDEETASKLMVRGTPAMYIDGKWDKTRKGYKELIND